jgi:carbon monoxide dehydrogenase subunit G
MAHYVATVRSPMNPAQAFDYMADVRNFVDWDPGVLGVTQVTGDGATATAVYDVEVKGVVGATTLRYATTDYEPPTRVQIEARGRLLTSIDRIDVRSEGDGCLVTYDADLRLNGALRVLNPVLALAFRRIGDRAAAGLVRVLDGSKVAT